MNTVTAREPGLRRPLILVVEDDPTLNSTISYNLRRAGFDSIDACDGETALRLFEDRRTQLSLILLDLMLPRLPGPHVLRTIRQTSSVPILILSARGQESDIVDGLDLGGDDYIVKPFALREVMARIRALLRRSQGATGMASVLGRGPIRIDSVGRRAWVYGNELALRPKEFGLLVTMAVATGKVFSRQELLDLVWGEEIVVDERTVDVHVSWLRGKLRRAGLAEDPIQTAYGSGYRFVGPVLGDPPKHPESLRSAGEDVRFGRATGYSVWQPKERNS